MNITTATFKPGSKSVTAQALYQWDYGQVLILEGLDLPDSYEVHFSNRSECGQADVRIGTDSGVVIPDDVLETGEPIYAFIFLHSDVDDGETVYLINIPVKKRPKPFYSTPTSTEQSLITEAIAALNLAVQKTELYASNAEESANNAEASAVEAQEAAAFSELKSTEAAESRDAAFEYEQNAEQYAETANAAAADADNSAQNAAAAEGNAFLSAQAASASEALAAEHANGARQSLIGVDAVVRESLSAAKASGEFNGPKGDKGTIFIPAISANGVISWTNNDGLANPNPVDMVSIICDALPLAEEARF